MNEVDSYQEDRIYQVKCWYMVHTAISYGYLAIFNVVSVPGENARIVTPTNVNMVY